MNNENKEFFVSDVEAEELTLEEKKPSTSRVLYEDISKRGKNTKHFRLQNGNFMAVTYDRPVHKLNTSTGKYENIAPDIRETEMDYEAETKNYKVIFPKKDGKKQFVTISKNGQSFSWKYIPNTSASKKYSIANIVEQEKTNLMEPCICTPIKYERVDGNTDIEYGLLDDEIKESIIFSKTPKTSRFKFELQLSGLIPRLNDDKKSIDLIVKNTFDDSENTEFIIPPAYMVDSAGSRCDDMHYEICQTETGVILEIVSDSDWLFEPERVYPIVLDPSVKTPAYGDQSIKTIEVSSNGSYIYGSGQHRRVGIDNLGNVYRTYLSVPLPELATGYKIIKSSLALHKSSLVSYENSDDYLVCAIDPQGRDLDISAFRWNSVTGLKNKSTIDVINSNSLNQTDTLEIDITETAKYWYSSSEKFHGIMMRKKDENPCYCNSLIRAAYMRLDSEYVSSHSCRPQMYVEYECEDIYSDHQKYHTFEAGRAGTGSINLFTGKMSFAHGDVATEGAKLPLAISHLYRPEFTQQATVKYGFGWRLSVEQKLEVDYEAGVTAVYTDAKGKRHYFIVDNSGNIVDDTGLEMFFRTESNCASGTSVVGYSLTDNKGNIMMFNDSGKLVKLIDANRCTNRFTYTGGLLTQASDDNGNVIAFKYDGNILSGIVDTNGREIVYKYDDVYDLRYIIYPSDNMDPTSDNSIKTEFQYDSDHRLIKIIDDTGAIYEIVYSSPNDNRVYQLIYKGSKAISHNNASSASETVEDTLTFEYRARSTAIKSERTKVKTVYRFDENGREISSYQDLSEIEDATQRSETTLASIYDYQPVNNNTLSGKTNKYQSLSVALNGEASEETNLLVNGCFEADNVNTLQPTGWRTVGALSGRAGVSDENYIPNKNSYFFKPYGYQKNNTLSQTVSLCDCHLNGNVLVASAWARASGCVNENSNTTTAKFRLVLTVQYDDGSSSEYIENYDVNCNDKWQYAAIPFVLKNDCCPVDVTFKLDYSSNQGVCYFTNARLVAVDGIVTTNTYRTDGSPLDSIDVFGVSSEIKMITTKKDSILTTMDYTDDYSDIVRSVMIDRNGRTFTTDYQYDDKHNLIKTQDYRGLVIEYTYNEYGKELTRKTYHKDSPGVYMFSEYTYQDGNLIASERDPRYSYNGQELKTTYQHDTKRNLLLKQTAVNGQEYNYSYDDKTDDLMSLSSTTDNKTNENQFFYTRGYLTRVAHNGFNFGFSFDQLGRSKSVTVGDNAATTTLLSMSYTKSGVNDITETAYASGEKNTVTTDMFGNPTISTYTDKNGNTRTISNATYDSVGKVKTLVDNERGVCYNYTYDAKGNVTKIIENDKTTGEVLATNTFVFDANERLTSKTYGAVGQTYRPVYEKNASGYVYPDNEVLGITLDGKFTDKVVKDGLRRASSKTLQVGSRTLFSESYSYLSTPKEGKTIATEIVSSVASHVYGTSANSSTLNYTYDKAGNLETVSNGTTLIAKYYYDGLNRLKREDNHTAGKTYVWDYDVGGNILFKKEYALCTDVNPGACLDTKTYTYKTEGWRDRLDSFNGQDCEYDHMGNPIKYRDNTLTWTKVRRLASFGSNTFEYGASGIRYRKNNTVYTLDGNKILRESDGTKTLTYYHGGSGIIGFNYNGTDCYFRKNLQGDVTEIYTSAGLKVASYAYDAWGKVIAVNNYTAGNIGDLNPIRYRSYYYDVETGLYYLNSRYYDPEVGRFINADTTDVLENAKYDINGLNLYAYCDNNPVAGRDDEGDMSFWKKVAIAVAVVAVVAVVAAATAATGGALCAVGTVLYGAAKGALVGAVVGAATGAATGAVQGAVEGYQETGTLDGTLRGMGKGALKGAVEGAKEGFISGMVGGAFSGAAMSMSGNPMFCFVAGTTVLTTLGKKAIETIRIGDTIPCVDHITGETAEKKVISTTVNKVNKLIELDIDGEIIRCTETHPFQVKGRGWVDAADLAPNDVVYTKDWNTATVKSVNLLEFDEPADVYNFEVEDCHTYFVGELGLLVHNGGCTEASRKGIQKHTEWNYGEGVRKEVKIGPGARVDGLDEVNKIVYELKPNNVNAINRGLRQLDRYLSILGDDWTGILLTY